ncbi:protein-disulfide isomerase, partial [Pseudomonas aeruginosa]
MLMDFLLCSKRRPGMSIVPGVVH